MSLLTEDKLHTIEQETKKLENHFSAIIKAESSFTRKLVSFQANKEQPFYRWYKYKEAFSASLVEYLLETYRISEGTIFDPFAGIGTTLFASALSGCNAEGIELLPVGQVIIKNRQYAQFKIKPAEIEVLKRWRELKPWEKNKAPSELNCLKITEGAYPEKTEQAIGKYLAELEREENSVSELLFLALMCILEKISYTRKDGQYLRWDYRSNKTNGRKKFNKGPIQGFNEAICSKLEEMITDIENPRPLSLFAGKKAKCGAIKLHKGSCLSILPELKTNTYDAIITSPPYCNRYDYTRTYALEHALLGISEKELLELRQTMLCCTVENKPKNLAEINSSFLSLQRLFAAQTLINEIVDYLEEQKGLKKLNNTGIPRMVKGYFFEMAMVIHECHRVLKRGGWLFMVNDNVRYAGVDIPVDLILSKMAEDMGYEIANILVLPQDKGNSSQQMGGYG
ncbi:MAG: hypothetical protein JW709_08085, partial [Sedimentisphaerales bacterium]|nr:hypothetical protein [Sedimentisphaerales bacterium]